MVYLNNEEFPLYSQDTNKTIISRIAGKLNTLPEFLFFEDPQPKSHIIFEENEFQKLPENYNIKVRDILNDIKIAIEDDSSSIEKIYNQYKSFFPNNKQLIFIWLSYNTIFDTINQMEKLISLYSLSSIKNLNIFPDNENIWNNEVESFIDKRKEYKENIEKRIKNNKDESKIIEDTFKLFQSTKEVFHTSLDIDTVSFNNVLRIHPNVFLPDENVDTVSLFDIFNSLKLTYSAPFSSLSSYFKFHKDFKPPLDWSISSEEAIYLWYNTRIDEKEISEAYKYAIFYKEDNNIKLNIDYTSLPTNLSKTKTVDKILSLINNLTVKIEDEQQENIKGVFYYPKQELNNYIFADLVMNDPIFSSYIFIDEHDKASKKKPSVYFYFKNPQTNDIISVTITEKIMIQSDYSLKNLSLKLFPFNKPYLRVRISKAKNENLINEFMTVFSKLLQIYNTKYNNMVDFYREFIPRFGEKSKIYEKTGKPLRLKDEASDIFVSGYSSSCGNKPVIVNKEDIKDLNDDEWLLFPLEGENKQYYVCKDEKFKYPGLLINNLENKEKYPYLPCCYTKPGNKIQDYIKYYEKGESEKQFIKQQQVLNTKKIANSSGFAHLPNSLEKLFNIIEGPSFNINNVYVRKGMARSESSFLECVLESLTERTFFLTLPEHENPRNLTDIERLEKTLIARKEISQLTNFNILKQELYDMNNDTIREELNNVNVYLDPKKYLRLLELYYNCKIFIFSDKDIILPRFSQVYYSYILRDKPVIFIYENMGSGSDKLDFPQCELIIRYKKNSPYNYYFDVNDNVSKEINNMFIELTKAYDCNNIQINEISLNINNKVKIISQSIDTFGKTRSLHIEFMGKNSFIITSPLPPLNIEEMPIPSNKWHINEALSLIKILNINIVYQNTTNKILQELIGKIGNVEIKIPVIDTSPLIDNRIITIENKTKIDIKPFYDDQISYFKEYINNKKLARYITYHFYHIFSSYIHKNVSNKSQVNIEDIKEFLRKHVIINPNFKYSKISKYFNDNVNSLYKNDKIIIKNDELLKRLLFLLMMKLNNDYHEIINYYKKIYMDNYYIDVNDFDHYDSQVIIQGENSIEKWIETKTYKNLLYYTVMPDFTHDYFLRIKKSQHTIFNSKIYLAKNVNTLLDAIQEAILWNVKNSDSDIDYEYNSEIPMFTLYNYKCKNIVEKYNILGYPNNYNIKIIGYKMDNISKFTVLLTL